MYPSAIPSYVSPRTHLIKTISKLTAPSTFTAQIRAFVKLTQFQAKISNLKPSNRNITTHTHGHTTTASSPSRSATSSSRYEKATDPKVIRARNVDHFPTQIETQTKFNRYGPDCGMLLSPIRCRPPMVTVTSLERGGESEENRLLILGLHRSLAERGWAIDGPQEGKRDQRISSLDQ